MRTEGVWALAIHGGAGTIPRSLPEAVQREYLAGLERALSAGQAILQAGGASLDAAEAAVRALEDDPLFNAGRGAVLTSAGTHELDASVMDGRTLRCGAVAAVKTPKNAVSLARLVMERTRHVLLAGEGADAFASQMGVERVPQSYFTTDKRKQQWEAMQRADQVARSEDEAPKGTVGAVALDIHGHLAAATSTGGLTNKLPGRTGDSSVIGAGTYADDRTAAVSCTGSGEEFIRHASAYAVCARMALAKESVEEAARAVIHQHMEPGDGGLIAVDLHGNIAFAFSSEGMYRGAAHSSGRFEVAIWE